MKKTVTIAFANNKGGSGKTTSCANIGYSLATLGKKVLLIDGDMQLNLSLSFMDEEKVLEYATSEKNLYRAVKEQKDLKDYVINTPYENLDIVPSSTLMSSIEYDLFTMWQREMILHNILESIKESKAYDFILIDAPPTLGGWVMNILCASDYIVMPVEASPWGLFGVANMFEFVDDVKKINKKLDLLGVLITKVDARKNYYKQSIDNLREAEGVDVFDTIIRVDAEVEWAQDNSKPIAVHKKSSRAAAEYLETAKEIIKKCQ